MLDKTELDHYCEALSADHSDLLSHLVRQTHLKTVRANMLSEKVQGRFLSFISRLVRPRRILEVGTFTGFATLCMAEGLVEDGRLITLEMNPELEALAQRFFDASPYRERIRLLIGDAKEVIPTLEETFDLVFIDAKKTDYQAYYDAVIDKVRPGGVIIADNTLWHGNVVNYKTTRDERTLSLHRFNEMMKMDGRVDNFLLPLRDGLHVGVRK